MTTLSIHSRVKAITDTSSNQKPSQGYNWQLNIFLKYNLAEIVLKT